VSIAGLVLAAGGSTRLNATESASDKPAFKLLLPFGPMTVVEAVVHAALAAGLSPVIVVVGHRANEVRRALDELDERVLVVENPAYKAGQSSSLTVGVGIARDRSDVEAVAVLLADEPGILPLSIRAVVTGWREAGAGIARAVYRDRPGHPVVFGRPTFEELNRLRGDQGAASLLQNARHAVCGVRIGSPAPVDVDTEQDYREALRRRGEDIAPE
jgi:molybdenum cofactor cytidylyltransferase